MRRVDSFIILFFFTAAACACSDLANQFKGHQNTDEQQSEPQGAIDAKKVDESGGVSFVLPDQDDKKSYLRLRVVMSGAADVKKEYQYIAGNEIIVGDLVHGRYDVYFQILGKNGTVLHEGNAADVEVSSGRTTAIEITFGGLDGRFEVHVNKSDPCDFPGLHATMPSTCAAIPKDKFWALGYQDKDLMKMTWPAKQALQQFTVLGPTSDPSIFLTDKGLIGIAAVGDEFFAITRDKFGQIDPKSGKFSAIQLDASIPAKGFSGITYDSKRKRIVLATADSQSHISIFDPSTSAAQKLADLIDTSIGPLTYDPAEDRIRALMIRDSVSEGFNKLAALSPETGAILDTPAKLSHILPGRLWEGRIQIAMTESYATAVQEHPFLDPDWKKENDVPLFRLFLIDVKSGIAAEIKNK